MRAIHDARVGEAKVTDFPIEEATGPHFDALRQHRNAIVVIAESLGLLADCVLNTLVDIRSGNHNANVLSEEVLTVLLIPTGDLGSVNPP